MCLSWYLIKSHCGSLPLHACTTNTDRHVGAIWGLNAWQRHSFHCRNVICSRLAACSLPPRKIFRELYIILFLESSINPRHLTPTEQKASRRKRSIICSRLQAMRNSSLIGQPLPATRAHEVRHPATPRTCPIWRPVSRSHIRKLQVLQSMCFCTATDAP